MSKITIPSLDRIDAVARDFLKVTMHIPVIAFSGELGVGKTTFVQALCRAQGVINEVNSPTFALVNEYFTSEGSSIFHFDLYRIEDPNELFDLGYEEYFFSGERCYIEWPEKARHLIPEDALIAEITITTNGTREINF
jgi:tRNA threonylcarbamoyladenosine biosynthesis protein TsaE